MLASDLARWLLQETWAPFLASTYQVANEQVYEPVGPPVPGRCFTPPPPPQQLRD